MTKFVLPTSIEYLTVTAFNKCYSLTEINLHNRITNLAENAFYNCSSLVSINIPESVTTIGGGPFYGCTASLESVTFEGSSNLKTINKQAFAYCSALTSLELPSSDTVIGSLVFYQCINLETVIMNGATEIQKQAFYECKKLKTVLMDSMKYIGEGAFNFCYELEINLPEGLLWIGDAAFNHCSNSTQTQIVIPSTLVKIGDTKYQSEDSSVEIVPGSHCFYNCATSTLKEFIVAEGNTNFVAHEGVLYTKDYQYLVSYPAAKTSESYEIPEGCEFLYELSFSRAQFLKRLTIPNSLEIKGDQELPENFDAVTNSLNLAIYCFNTIEEFVVKGDNANYCAIDGIIYSKDGTELIAVPTRKVFQSTLTFANFTTIEDIAFYCHDLRYETDVTINGVALGSSPAKWIIPASVTYISDRVIEALNARVKLGMSIESLSSAYIVNDDGYLQAAE